MQDKVLKMALIGVGNMGKKYAQMIVSGEVLHMKLAAVVIRRDEQIAWGKTLVNVDGQPVEIFRSADELFHAAESDPSLFDAVLIATPHKTHKELAVRAFELKKNDRIYGLVFHQRLYPKYMKIKEMIDSGEIGTLKRVSLINSRYLRTSHYHKSGSWRSSFAGEGGGALINQGQHILDIFQYLFGMPQRLFAVIPFGKYNPFAVDDEDTIVMEYDTGMTASFILTTGEACCEERMEIIGTKARLLLEDNTLSITRFDDIEKYIKTEDVNSREHLHFTEEKIMYEKSAEPYTQLLEKFAQAALKHDEGCLVAKGAEGLHSLMLCAGAYYSACKGIRVDLPLDAVRYKELMDNLIEDEKNTPVM